MDIRRGRSATVNQRVAVNRVDVERSIDRSATAAFPVSWRSSGLGLAGFFHPALGPSGRAAVVVLCNPLGWEAVASQRGYRHLAERLAQAGFPVLRFDYPGTGDSLAGDEAPQRVREWLDGVHAAIARAQELSDKREVSLVGVQMGGTLAAAAAIERGGVASLVLWAAHAKGRSYLRELKAFRALNGGDPTFPRAEDQGGLEAAGFLLSASTLDELARIDLLAAPTAPAPKVLLVARDQRPQDQALIDHWRSLAVEVEPLTTSGYQDLMQEPRKSVVPDLAFAAIVGQLTRFHPALEQASPVLPSPPSREPLRWAAPSGVELQEEPITFGPGGRFFGILSEPVNPPASPLRPAILFLTTASHHRVGPNRMFVPLARELAERGFTSLRFDLTGVGDSPATEGVIEGHAYSKSFVADVREAMDHLQRASGFTRFVTVGLCSGAYLGFHSSLADPRVVGEVLINPQTFNWKDGDSLEINQRVTFMSSRFYRRAALDPATWKRLFKGEINLAGIGRALAGRLKTRAQVEWKRAVRAVLPTQTQGDVDVGDAFESLATRAADVFLIYGANDEGLDHLSAQVGSRLRRLKKLPHFQIEIIEGPDHTFTQLWAQEKLRALIVGHLQDRFGASSATPGA